MINMESQFEKRVIEKLASIEELVKGLDTLNRNIESLIKILVENQRDRALSKG